jgi:hypothetical protein
MSRAGTPTTTSRAWCLAGKRGESCNATPIPRTVPSKQEPEAFNGFWHINPAESRGSMPAVLPPMRQHDWAHHLHRFRSESINIHTCVLIGEHLPASDRTSTAQHCAVHRLSDRLAAVVLKACTLVRCMCLHSSKLRSPCVPLLYH